MRALALAASTMLLLAGCGKLQASPPSSAEHQAQSKEAAPSTHPSVEPTEEAEETEPTQPLEEKSVSIGVPQGWGEGEAVSALWAIVLTDRGYEVNLNEGDPAKLFIGLQGGSFDLYLGAYANMHAEQIKGGGLTDLGAWFTDAGTGLAVTKDSPAKSIDDLKDHAKEYGKVIVGVEPGAGVTQGAQDAVAKYGLSGWKVESNRTDEMLADLDKADGSGKDLVFTTWQPNWLYAKYGVRDLEDSKNAFGAPDEIHSVGDPEFADDHPRLAAALKDFTMTDEEINTLLLDVHEAGDARRGAQKWLKDNDDFAADLERIE